MIKAVIFDLYGVLGLNSWQAFKERHFAHCPEDWESLRALGQRVDAGEATEGELVAAIAIRTGETEETVRYQFEHTVPNVDLLTYAKTLAPRFAIGVLSNASRDVVADIFSTEEQGVFSAVVTSFHVGLTKPDPGIFQKVLDELHVHAHECIFVDDQQRHIDAAKALGFSTILHESNANTIKQLKELLRHD